MSQWVISDLRARPEFSGAIADRIWRAWWQARDIPLTYIAGRVAENLRSDGIPCCFVAHDGDTFLGTASLIDSDLDERPQYAPWVAAVWVEPDRRMRGIGAALVRAAARACFDLGFETAYLCARPAKRKFYEDRGWRRLEENVDGVSVLTMSREA